MSLRSKHEEILHLEDYVDRTHDLCPFLDFLDEDNHLHQEGLKVISDLESLGLDFILVGIDDNMEEVLFTHEDDYDIDAGFFDLPPVMEALSQIKDNQEEFKSFQDFIERLEELI